MPNKKRRADAALAVFQCGDPAAPLTATIEERFPMRVDDGPVPGYLFARPDAAFNHAMLFVIDAIKVLKEERVTLADARLLAVRWQDVNSPYSWLEHELGEHPAIRALGAGPSFARLVAACHIMQHRDALKLAFGVGDKEEFWKRAYYIARHGSTMQRAALLLNTARNARSEGAKKAADARHAYTKRLRSFACELFAAGTYPSIAAAARDIYPKIVDICQHDHRPDDAPKPDTIDDWLRQSGRRPKTPK